MMENQNTPQSDNLNELMTAFRGLQQRLLQEVVNSHAETEMTLKQLVAYLNVSAQNLTEVHNIVTQFNATVEALKSQVDGQTNKLDKIEDRVNALPNETYKLKEIISTSFNTQNQNIGKYLAQTNEYLKRLYTMVGQQGQRTQNLENTLASVIKTIETDLNKNHENLTGIITTLIENKSDIDTKVIESKSHTAGQSTKRYELKLQFWAKIIGILFASGGFLYTVIDLIIKSMAK